MNKYYLSLDNNYKFIVYPYMGVLWSFRVYNYKCLNKLGRSINYHYETFNQTIDDIVKHYGKIKEISKVEFSKLK